MLAEGLSDRVIMNKLGVTRDYYDRCVYTERIRQRERLRHIDQMNYRDGLFDEAMGAVRDSMQNNYDYPRGKIGIEVLKAIGIFSKDPSIVINNVTQYFQTMNTDELREFVQRAKAAAGTDSDAGPDIVSRSRTLAPGDYSESEAECPVLAEESHEDV